MIVLDEQLLGRNLEQSIAAWYPGAVCFITDLRPHSVIKDDAIPSLLESQNEATFVTINESDFWRVVAANKYFCMVCVALPDSQASRVAELLRLVLGHPRFATKALRMGCIVRVSVHSLAFYSLEQPEPQNL